MTTKNSKISSIVSTIGGVLPIAAVVFYGVYYFASFDFDVRELKEDIQVNTKKIDDLDDKMDEIYALCEKSRIIRRLGIADENGKLL